MKFLRLLRRQKTCALKIDLSRFEQDKAEKTLPHVLEPIPNYPQDPRAPFRVRGMPNELIEGLMAGDCPLPGIDECQRTTKVIHKLDESAVTGPLCQDS